MGRPAKAPTGASIPKYRHDKPKDLGVVRIDGRDHDFGRYNSPESLEKYGRVIAEWVASGRVADRSPADDPRTRSPSSRSSAARSGRWSSGNGSRRCGPAR